MFKKIEVNGPNTHPVYQFLRSNSSLYDETKQVATEIPWNFSKFLVNREGKVIGFYPPTTAPVDLKKTIQDELQN